MFDYAQLHPLFAPTSVAIVGASNDENKIGGRPIAFLRKAGYLGRVVPVNPTASQVQGFAAVPSLADCSGAIEHAILAVPARDILAAARQCAQRGVKAIQVFSSGFADIGNQAAQDELLALVRSSGIRMLGPNSLGLFNANEGFYGTFATALDGAWPESGSVGFATQSGAFGSYCYGLAQARGLKFSKFVATGNEADVDVAECIAWLARDERTGVIVATFEGCRDGRRLCAAMQLAHEAGKPLLVMKAGSSEAGAQAAATHTGSLAGKDAVFDGSFRQFGALRARSLDELIDAAYALSLGRRPRGPRLGIVTTSGGIGVLMADRVSQSGLELPPMQGDAQRQLAAALPSAVASNPLDTSTAVLGDLGKVAGAMRILIEGASPDVVLGFLGHVGRNATHYAQLRGPLFELVAQQPDLAFALCMLAPLEVRADLEAHGVLLFEEPTRAVAALHAVSEVNRALQRFQPGFVATESIANGSAVTLRALDERASKQRVAQAGVAAPMERVVADAQALEAALSELDAPRYALKIVSPDITHKTDVGGVKLNVAAADCAAAFAEVMEAVARNAPQARLDGVLLTPMIEDGVDAILGALRDPVFGPVVMFGLGGTWVEVFADVVFRVAPVDEDEALRMIGQTRVASLLDGVRGTAPVDPRVVARGIAAFSRHFAEKAAQLESIEVNPWRLLPRGGVALDAVVVERHAQQEQP